MVKLPPTFTATKIPGYFWDVESLKLFSIKSGELKPMKMSHPSRFNHFRPPHYRVSHHGARRLLFQHALMKLKVEDSEIGVNDV